MSSLAFLVTELQVRQTQCLLSWLTSLNTLSHLPVRHDGSTPKSVRCVNNNSTLGLKDLSFPKAAEKSLKILRASPEQATISLATGMKCLYTSCEALRSAHRWSAVRRLAPTCFHGMCDEECQSGRHIAWVPAATHRLEGCPSFCRATHHNDPERQRQSRR